jgi:hypothetical protein
MDGDDDVQLQSGAGSPREYNFSDDFNISEVKDAADKSDTTPLSANGSLPKSLSEAVDKSLSQISKPGTGTGPQVSAPTAAAAAPRPFTPTPPIRQPGASINILEQKPISQDPVKPVIPVPPARPAPMPTPAPAASAGMRPDPFREPITKLDNEWPFASPETLAQHRDREKQPFEMPQKQPTIPSNLPVGEVEAPVAPVAPAISPRVTPPLSNFIRPASMPPVPPPTRPGLGLNPVMQPRQPIVPPTPSSSPMRPGTNTPVPAAGQTPGAGLHPGGLKNIRTYESDVADALAARPVTRTSIALDESKKRGEGAVIGNGPSVVVPASRPMNIPSRVVQSGLTVELDEKSHTGWKIMIVILSLALIGGGAVGGYYLYSQSPLADIPAIPAVTVKQTPALVPYDAQTAINIDGANNVEILKRISTEISKPLAAGTIKEIVLTEVREGQTYRATAPETILLAGIPVPDMIARTLSHEWMLGAYGASSGAKPLPFIVVHTNLFQNAFAGMLAWEPSMIRDLQVFLGIPYDKPTPKGSFKDQIVKNKDVRAFVTEDGSTIFEYSFIDNSTLIVTGDNETLSAIISRLESRAFVR